MSLPASHIIEATGQGAGRRCLLSDKLRRFKDRRDRLAHASCDDEPSSRNTTGFQRILDQVYALKESAVLRDAYALLTDNQRLPTSAHQRVRRHYLLGEYYRALDRAGRTVAHLDDKLPLTEAADQFRLAASIARGIPDLALYAQLKSLESAVCSTAEVRQLRRSYEAARDALNAWRSLPFRDLTPDVHYEFTLADTLGLRAGRVAEDVAAVDALERAAVLLQRLHGRPDMDATRYANDDLFLNWDWAAIYIAQDQYRLAFRHALRARRHIDDLTNPINIGRLHRLVAVVALTCAEERGPRSFVRMWLLTFAAQEIEAAYIATRACADHAGQAMVLLAAARLLGLRGVKRGRLAKIKEAQKMALLLDDPNLRALVETGWGDEAALRGDIAKAAAHYRQAEASLTALDFGEQARVARQRLQRLPPPVAASAAATTTTPPPANDVSLN